MEYGYAMEKSATDLDLEKMMTRLVSETQELLSSHRPLLQDLSLQLAASGSLEAKEIQRVAAKHHLNIEVKEEGYLQIPAYSEQLNPKPVVL